jgi:hypothetical protein
MAFFFDCNKIVIITHCPDCPFSNEQTKLSYYCPESLPFDDFRPNLTYKIFLEIESKLQENEFVGGSR